MSFDINNDDVGLSEVTGRVILLSLLGLGQPRWVVSQVRPGPAKFVTRGGESCEQWWGLSTSSCN